jgi:hypothetical protein
LLRVTGFPLKINAELRVLDRHIDGEPARNRETGADLSSNQMAGGIMSGTGKRAACQQSDIRYRPIFQWAKEDMPDHPVDRRAFGKIQDIDKIITSGIDVQRMLIGGKNDVPWLL